MQEELNRLMESRTTLVVAHRLSTLRKADKMAVLANGTIEAFAPHYELLRISDTYKKLWKAQERGGKEPGRLARNTLSQAD